MTTLGWTCRTRAAPSCDMFNLGSSYFHVALTTVRHLLNDDPRLNMSHSGCALVWHVQPRVVIFPCHTHYRPSCVKCHRHATSTQAQVHLCWTAWRSDLSSVNYCRSCVSCCWSKGVDWPAKRCYVAWSLLVFKNILVPPLLRKLFDFEWHFLFLVIICPPEQWSLQWFLLFRLL